MHFAKHLKCLCSTQWWANPNCDWDLNRNLGVFWEWFDSLTIRFGKWTIGIRFHSLIFGIRFELRDSTAKSSVGIGVYLFHSCVASSSGRFADWHLSLPTFSNLAFKGNLWHRLAVKFITKQSYDIS